MVLKSWRVVESYSLNLRRVREAGRGGTGSRKRGPCGCFEMVIIMMVISVDKGGKLMVCLFCFIDVDERREEGRLVVLRAKLCPSRRWIRLVA